MEDWDQETLEKVVESKKKEYNQNKPTEIVRYPVLPNLHLHYILLFTMNTHRGSCEENRDHVECVLMVIIVLICYQMVFFLYPLILLFLILCAFNYYNFLKKSLLTIFILRVNLLCFSQSEDTSNL